MSEREMDLYEWVHKLPDEHLAVKQYLNLVDRATQRGARPVTFILGALFGWILLCVLLWATTPQSKRTCQEAKDKLEAVERAMQ
mgnify:FL=1